LSRSTKKTGLNKTAAVILAAGKGKRMRSSRPKVLHRLAGKPLVCWVVEAAQKAGIEKIIVVIGFKGEEVKRALKGYPVEFVWQKVQLGTGHAVRMAYPKLKNFRGTLLVLAGDVPASKPQTIRRFVDFHQRQKAIASVLTARWPDPTGYGRIIRAKSGDVLRIVEHKDATPEERKIREVNTGTLIFRIPPFFKLLSQIKNQNTQKEYYLTDVITVLNRQKKKVTALLLKNLIEAQGVNSREELQRLERAFRV
jgi:bifunctional UDP-N-acetylglucosamine pyrophosphorylase/glucosamine-1-phosphate N-acetyltransferase